MAAEQDLSFIAKRIRTLVDTERSDDLFLKSVWKLVCKAIELGAFAFVEFTEFKAFFDAWRETEQIHTQPCRYKGEDIGGQHDKLPLTMLDAVNWLAKNGSVYGCPNINLKRVMPWDMIPEDNGYSCSEQISYPKRDTLRPHFELLAILVEWMAPKPTEVVAASISVDAPQWDENTEARNKWLYGQCRKGKKYSAIIADLKNKPKSWARLEHPDSIKKAAEAYATRKQLPPIPRRSAGRPKQK